MGFDPSNGSGAQDRMTPEYSPPEVFKTSRSRHSDWLRCNRARWWLHEAGGTGYESVKVAIPLATGGSVHIGVAELLRGRGTEAAVNAAIDDYEQKVSGRGLDLADLESQSFVFGEQKALVEALVRLAGMRVVPRILEIYEVLEVERLDTVEMAGGRCRTCNGAGFVDVNPGGIPEGEGCPDCSLYGGPSVVWRSIPDALLRKRDDGGLYILSWKTASEVPRDDDARVDHQGLSEAWSVEKRLEQYWHDWSTGIGVDGLVAWTDSGRPEWFYQRAGGVVPKEINGELYNSVEFPVWAAPPKIRGVQMVYLVKGQRRDAGKEAAAAGALKKTASPLIYGYQDATGPVPKYAWGTYWRCSQPHPMRKSQWYPTGMCPGDGRDHKRGDEWKSFPVWTSLGVKTWMEMLDSGLITPEAGDALDQQWALPVPNFRTMEAMSDWEEQTRTTEERMAADSRAIKAGRMSLNASIFGSQATEQCNHWFGRRCPAWDLCWGPPHIADDPVGSGLYQIKTQYQGGDAHAAADDA